MIAEPEKSRRRRNSAVGNVGREIVKGLLLAGVIVDVIDADTGSSAVARVAPLKFSAGAQRTVGDVLDRFVGAGEEEIPPSEISVVK